MLYRFGSSNNWISDAVPIVAHCVPVAILHAPTCRPSSGVVLFTGRTALPVCVCVFASTPVSRGSSRFRIIVGQWANFADKDYCQKTRFVEEVTRPPGRHSQVAGAVQQLCMCVCVCFACVCARERGHAAPTKQLRLNWQSEYNLY